VVTGHGIDLDHFDSQGEQPDGLARVLSVGRLTPRKDPLSVIEAVRILAEEGREIRLDLVGGGRTVQDVAYGERVREAARDSGLGERIAFAGEVPYLEIPAWYARSTVVVNASLTGSLDKTALEAMAMRRPLLSCNEAAQAALAELGPRAAQLAFAAGDARGLARRIAAVADLPRADYARLGEDLRGIVRRGHEVEALAARLVREMGGAA
jgi:glycosyltransferase involved in cell wall biosynthesis